jgi:hypothetical protein
MTTTPLRRAGGLVALGAALALAMAACADSPPQEVDQGVDDTGGRDSGGRGDAELDEDSGAADVGGEDTAQDPGVDSAPDLVTEDQGADEEVTLVGECEPFSSRCAEDGYAVQRCSADGAWFEPSDCSRIQVCDDTGGSAACIRCIEGVNCRLDEPVCEPGLPFCSNFETAARCTDEGRIGEQTGCAPGRCFGGGCVTSGNDAGEACAADADCVSRTCLCGTDDALNAGTDLCAGNMLAGYCTTDSCGRDSCDPDTEICADFGLSGAFGGGEYCLLRERCTERLASCRVNHRGDDFVCRALPSAPRVGEPRTWSLGCWVPPPTNATAPCATDDCISPIGGACRSDADCIGGVCLRSGALSYCAATCDEESGCPDYAACVRAGEGGAAFCLARANEDDCPRMVGAGFDIVARTFASVDGLSSIPVCYFQE